jgi:two-component system nitrogen regulation sensor histidine kinase GlnL
LPLSVSVNVSPLYTDAGVQSGIILTLHDVSNFRQLEQDIQRAQHLEMLKTLAAGLAHEVKNPLGGIRGAAQLLAMELDQRRDLREYTQVMIKETDRINGIIEELMNLTSPRSKVISEVNLSKTINDIVLLQAQTEQGRKIQFNLQLDPSIPPIKGDQTLLTRLFLNLIKNATEALTRDGDITISTRIDSEHHLTRPGQTTVSFVVVRISDNGPGISAKILQKIFTPFYTTKSNGSGLGLAICQKIVTDHDGLLRLDSTPNQGTCCSVYLPFISTIIPNTDLEL